MRLPITLDLLTCCGAVVMLAPSYTAAYLTGEAMAAVGTRGEFAGSRTTRGFALAFKADTLWVGAGAELVDGPAASTPRRAGVTRVRLRSAAG